MTATIQWAAVGALTVAGAVCAAPLPRVPEGFVIEQVAGEPEIRFPMFAAFDDRGRLFVAESSGGDLYEELQMLERKCRISVLEDRDGDGRYESAHVFADHLVMPMGLAWRDGRLYVAEGPAMITLEDTDDDGRADRRTTILDGFGHSDNGSLHGTTFGPDGLLYMTIGQPDGYRFTDAAGKDVWGRTGALIRCRPDGSHPEVVCRGFENLVEIVFLPTGEIIGTDNWFQLPSGGIRDALVHLVEGGKYPIKPDDGSPLPVTGGDLPAIATFPAVSFSGIAHYRSTGFPSEMQGDLFAAQFNSRRVQRHVLVRDGATFRSEAFDFVEGDDPDFHPSDVLVAPDGSLLVIDTGGWYVQHCPTGKIRESFAPGGIFRVRFTGQPGVGERASGLALDAMWQLPTPALVQDLGGDDHDAAALAARILGSRGERDAAGPLAWLLESEVAHVRLAAAEALGHCGDAGSLPAIWAALPAATDPFLKHALIHAALHVADAHALRAALASGGPAVQEAALQLLDQPPHSSLTSEDVIAHLSAADESLRQTARRILQGHPEWETAAVELIRNAFGGAGLDGGEADRLQSLALAFQRRATVQELVAALATDRSLPDVRRVLLIGVIAQNELADLPARWRDALSQTLADGTPVLRAAAVNAIATLQPDGFDVELAAIADSDHEEAAVRFDASRALVARGRRLSAPAVGFLTSQLAPDTPPLSRLTAAQILARCDLDAGQTDRLRRLAGDDPLVGPLLIPAPATSTDQQRNQLARYDPLLTGGGDPARGRDIYFGKAACAVCHRAGNEGGQLGPDLTGVGAIRARRDLVESIVLPSATFAQRYEPYTITMQNGDSLTGTIVRESPDSMVVRDAGGAEQRLGRADIRTVARSDVSFMPPGLDHLLETEEFRDLLAYLETLR